ncbi:MAG: GTPase Era [Anaerolineales bacterium]|jgi:GTP-binding protein Era
MVGEQIPSEHRSGFVAVIGRPNVGKSTLINRYLRQSVVPVSPRPQTTRRRQLAILTLPQAQVIFVDTPGIHKPHHKLGEYMNAAARRALEDADLLLAVFDLSALPTEDDERVIERILALDPGPPTLAALNKVDTLKPALLPKRLAAFTSMLPQTETIAISALRGDGCQELLERLLVMLPKGPRFYPEDEITDAFERDIAADLIRAAALHLLRDEVPHSIAVSVEDYKERNQHGAYIRAILFVERESQKGIVIGKKGSMLKEIGTFSRRLIEEMSGRKVYLDLHVKVLPKWRNDENALRRFGFVARKR